MKKVITKNEKETLDLAESFATELRGGEVIGLNGNLGSGKTVFVKGLAKSLGVKNIITSPTFVLLKPYKINGQSGAISQLVHIDAYRLDSGQQLAEIGIEEYFNSPNCITVIEWADRVKDILPPDVILLQFKVVEGNVREIIIK